MPLRMMLPVALESWLVTAEAKFYRALSKGPLLAHLLSVDDIPQEIVHVSEREPPAGKFCQYDAAVL